MEDFDYRTLSIFKDCEKPVSRIKRHPSYEEDFIRSAIQEEDRTVRDYFANFDWSDARFRKVSAAD